MCSLDRPRRIRKTPVFAETLSLVWQACPFWRKLSYLQCLTLFESVKRITCVNMICKLGT